MQKRYVQLLFKIADTKRRNIYQLSRAVNMTPSHLTRVMSQWHRERLINKVRTKKDEREFEIELTEIGKEVVEIVRKYNKIARKQMDIAKDISKEEVK